MGDLESDTWRESRYSCSGCRDLSHALDRVRLELDGANVRHGLQGQAMLDEMHNAQIERDGALALSEARKAVVELFTRDFDGHDGYCGLSDDRPCTCNHEQKKAALETLRKLETKA